MAGSPRRAAGRRLQLPLLCLLLQGATAILFAVFVRYNPETDAAVWHSGNRSSSDNEFYFRYPSECGISELKPKTEHGLTLYIDPRLREQGQIMINADFCAAAVLISFGAVLGKTGPAQLLLMALLEVLLFGVNEFVLLSLLGVSRVGPRAGRARVSGGPQREKSQHRLGSVYHSDLFAMIGTIFLWTFWPSFNSAPTMLGDGQHRTTLNTYYSLTASTLSTFALSALVGEHGRLDMVHIQNAALAGGVVVGTSGEMMLTPFGALAAGFLAGTVSTLGYKFFTPVLEAKFKLQDTCGVHNLHGMPGVLGALLGVLVAGLATHEAYGDGLGSVFPLVAEGQRSATSQAMYQLFGLLVTLTFASVGGGLGASPSPAPPPPTFQVPGEREDEAQGSLRAEETDTRA
uniref:Ammonium transporter Rh type B n=1 Tax=Panthera tigris altaica TaxID=74533 RepID=A0A8C9K2T8_PANTA